MRTVTMFTIAVCLLLTSTLSGRAQTIAIQNEVDAVLELQRAGAVVVFERGVAVQVSLSGLKTADRLLNHVKILTSLESLELAGTGIMDASLEKIRGLTKLRSLNLASSRVGDKGLEHLKGLRDLTSLSLYGTNVTDEGLGHLKPLNKLDTLIVKNTRVTLAGAGKLLEVLPKVSILGIKECETGYIRVEMAGTLLKEILDKKEHWYIKVTTARAGEISWQLDFLASAEMQRSAQRLEKKAVIITGEIVRDLHFPGVGGESFLVPPPAPKVLVRTLRAAEQE